jgi:hypothetical protein
LVVAISLREFGFVVASSRRGSGCLSAFAISLRGFGFPFLAPALVEGLVLVVLALVEGLVFSSFYIY